MEPGASSLLLQFLAQLGQDATARVLLPTLLQQGSGPALAATCSQLQMLVHSSRTSLALKNFWQADNPGLTEAWTAGLPNHFPSCTHVGLQAPFPAVTHCMAYVISTLARLPNLNAISISVAFTEKPMVALSTVLYSMRTQLTGLKSLTLELQECDATGLSCAWQELGRATQLTALDVKVVSRVEDNLENYLKDAAALSALQGLMVLRVTDDNTADWSFLSGLTALTELALARGTYEGTAAVGSCMALRDLTLSSGADDPQLSAALARLTGLTRLNLKYQSVGPGSECAQALGCLTHLRWLGAFQWAPELLPVLQGLPQLSTISGRWEQPAAQLSNVQLPQVCTLLIAGGCAPLEAFPRLITAQLDGATVPPGVLLKLVTCCPQLQELVLGLFDARNVDTAAVTKGLQSLPGLRHLKCLVLHVCDEAQLAAAAAACMVLGQGSLKALHVVVLNCRFSSLLRLSNLAGLDALLVVFSGSEQQSQEVVRVEDAELLLSGLSGVRNVGICCGDHQVRAALRAAAAWAAERDLPIACRVDVVRP